MQRDILIGEQQIVIGEIMEGNTMFMSYPFEDGMTRSSSTEELNVKNQREYPYDRLLPYAAELDEDARKLLDEITGELGRAVMLRKIHPDCIVWTSKLMRFLNVYDLKFSLDVRISLIHMMHELLTIPDIDSYSTTCFASALVKLLSKPDAIPPNELKLPWKPLFDLYRQLSRNSSQRKFRFMPTSLVRVRSVILRAKFFFSVQSATEILEESRPMLCPIDPKTMTIAVELLELLLPSALKPEHMPEFKIWFKELMMLWEISLNPAPWEFNMMRLMARLASWNIGYIEWDQYVPLLYSRFVRSLDLPVQYKKNNASLSQRIEAAPMALFMVSMLGGNYYSQAYFERFMKTIDTYVHQANFGPWTKKLVALLDKLAYYFVQRVHRERYADKTWVQETPESHLLKDEHIDHFVKAMMPVAMTAMYGRHALHQVCEVLHNLATMRANLVLPAIIERMYENLESVTAPHKLTSTMMAMIAVARPMVQGNHSPAGYGYDEGPMHVIPILEALLPAIDVNDFNKSAVAARLIATYAILVPMIDNSKYQNPTNKKEQSLIARTERFESFVLQYFDRIFQLIEDSTVDVMTFETQEGLYKSSLEGAAEGTILITCFRLLSQTSGTIFEAALEKLQIFVSEHILETKVGAQLLGAVCNAFTKVNGEATLRVLLPRLTDVIFATINDDEYDVRTEERLDDKLLYAMVLLSRVVSTPGVNLFPHMKTITKVFDALLRVRSREGSEIMNRMLRSVFQSLVHVTPTGFLTKGHDYNDTAFPWYKYWGQGFDINDLEIKWYVPTTDDVAMIQKLFETHILPELENIQKHSAKEIKLTRHELRWSLTNIATFLDSCDIVLPFVADPAPDPDDEMAVSTSFLPVIGVRGEITMPDGSNVRLYILKVVSALQATMMCDSEDDTKALCSLTGVWLSLLVGNTFLNNSSSMRHRYYNSIDGCFKDHLTKGNNYLGGAYIIQRLQMHHEKRLLIRCHALPYAHRQIFHELLTLATSRYAAVRIQAQYALSAALQLFPRSHEMLVPRIVQILGMDPTENHDAFKGVLHLCGGHTQPLMTIRNWSTARLLWPALILSRPSEKPSVIKLKEVLMALVAKTFFHNQIKLEVPEQCLETARKLWMTSQQLTLPQPEPNEIREGIAELEKLGEKNLRLYDELVDELMNAILAEDTHWRHRYIAINFLKDLERPDRPYPERVLNYFLSALIHDSLAKRKVALETVVYMLTQNKRPHKKVEIDPEKFQKNGHEYVDDTGVWYPGVRSDNVWLQYNYEKRPLTESQWNELSYVHDNYMGYYTWPKGLLKVYDSPSNQPELDPSRRQLTKHERVFSDFFSQSENIDKLINYYSLEEHKGKDTFIRRRVQLFKGLFRNHGNVHLPHFMKHLRRLVVDRNESSQRCAAEIIAGLIKGTKHWTFAMVDDMWKELTPIIRNALNNITGESVTDWARCFSIANHNKDPNRHHWLLECLLEEPALGDSTSALIECGRLRVLHSAVLGQAWRLCEIMKRLSIRIEQRLTRIPLEKVRYLLGDLLAVIYSCDLTFANTDSDRFTPRVHDFLSPLLPRLRTLIEESVDEENSERNSETLCLFKTICAWIYVFDYRSVRGTIPDFLEILPIMCQLENSETDPELSAVCNKTLAVVAQSLLVVDDLRKALNVVKKIANGPSLSARIACLNFLEVLIFNNMGGMQLDENNVIIVHDIILELLWDQRLEVRETAAKVLKGLIHCKLINNQEFLLREFTTKARRPIKVHDDVKYRHGGVLGLCAFINAHPYDMPSYLPPVIEELDCHINDPQPIPATIRKTIGDFNRTHYDSMPQLRSQLSENQRDALLNLSASASYYA